MRGGWLGSGFAAWALAGTVSLVGAEPIPEPFSETLAAYSTTLIGSLPARTDNIRLAARALDGVVLEPRQLFSFNAVVGRRTAERGYQPAPVILHESRDVQVGGGVCQVASTLFDAALLAGLQPVERHPHSYAVDYIPPAQDATIVWGAKDLKLRNTLSQRVRIRADVLGTTLTIRIEGEDPLPASFELSTSEQSTAAAAPGASPGREIDLYRVRLVEGNAQERELIHRDVVPSALAPARR